MSQRTLVLCADDYGLSPGVSEAILALLERGRLSATSCIVLSENWPATARHLDSVQDRADIGLHLTLTNLAPLGPMPGLAPDGRLPELGVLLRRALARRLDRQEIEAELDRQLDAFTDARGTLPDFIDGHQHVHVLPVVREAVIALMQRRLGPDRVYMRSCWEPPAAIMRRRVAVGRALVIAFLSRHLPGLACRAGVAINDSFRGVSDFRIGRPYAREFRRFLEGFAARPLIMCHPGFVDGVLRELDPVTHRREEEYRYLSSAAFLRDLEAAGWTLGRFPRGGAASP